MTGTLLREKGFTCRKHEAHWSVRLGYKGEGNRPAALPWSYVV